MISSLSKFAQAERQLETKASIQVAGRMHSRQSHPHFRQALRWLLGKLRRLPHSWMRIATDNSNDFVVQRAEAFEDVQRVKASHWRICDLRFAICD